MEAAKPTAPSSAPCTHLLSSFTFPRPLRPPLPCPRPHFPSKMLDLFALDLTVPLIDTWNLGDKSNKPITAIIIGMAGSGKTTLTQRLNAYVHEKKLPTYLINLDPAVANIKYKPNIDIRESLNYKDVMQQYQLGPNGAILTSLNLFSTRFDQVMNFVDQRAPNLQYIVLDTPGQIEVFNWSASGAIITESFASSYPTVFVYVVDTPRSTNPQTFMSNMLYACSLFYKARLPLVLVFTKTDVVKHDFCLQWMTDFEAFDEACRSSDRYVANFTQSMGLMLGEFYANFPCVGVSAVTGEGMEDLFAALQSAAHDYNTGYKVEMDQMRAQHEASRINANLSKLKADGLDLKMRSPLNEVGQKIDAIPKESGGEGTAEDDEDASDEGEDATERAVYEQFVQMIKEQKKAS